MRDKQRLTEVLVSQLPDGSEETVERAMNLWWYNIRRNGGLRLSELGYFNLKKILDIESYEMAIDWATFDRRTILALDRKLQMPYYIMVKKKIPQSIVFFGSREAMLAQLYGDLNRFLDNYQ